LTKINFSSKGKKEHFYRLMTEQGNINIYETINSKIPYKAIFFTDIIKFSYGISSSNLKKRFKNLSANELKSPWLFFSIVTKERSHDLYLDEGKLNTWFYGIKCYLRRIDMPFKMISVHNFVFTRTKLKLMFLMKEHYGDKKAEKMNTDNSYKGLVKCLAKGKLL
jgi:hypothetical protein